MTTATEVVQNRRLGFGIGCALVNNLLVGMGTGIYLPLFPLRLDMMGESPSSIGLHAISSSIGVLLVAPYMSTWLSRIGAPFIIAIGCAAAVIAGSMMLLADDYWLWFALRLIMGCGLATHWVGSDAWLNQAATEKIRGRILSFYVVSYIGGVSAGSALLNQLDLAGNAPFIAMVVCFSVALLPLILAWRSGPVFLPSSREASLRMFRIAPVLMTVGVLIGLADGAAFALIPLFAVLAGMTEYHAVWVMTSFLLGGSLMQFPIGWLSDVMDRRHVLVLLSVLAVGIAPILPFVMNGGPLTWILSGLFGAAVIGMYAVSLGIIGRRFTGGDMAAANAVFVLCFEFGALTGAPVGGGAMDIIGAPGLPIVMGVASALVLAAALFRGQRWISKE
ncbi:MFS transporter [Hwanghaeella grinnelliae]|uniref:MFS transporter n=1 Tax=Hwanghaeella grinnelliae TaxID=2500179 RepID=A0A3S2W7Z1_9PROT|nr:MFS transporter [Hwanghaeella grinnelliae]RVU34995.1 MFS transporter [Hwanghaeella grinnelliae]